MRLLFSGVPSLHPHNSFSFLQRQIYALPIVYLWRAGLVTGLQSWISLRCEFSASRSKAGVAIPRLPIFHSAPGYMYFFLDTADGEILKVQRITQSNSIAELFVYYCYFRVRAALWHPHNVFHFKLPLDIWVLKAKGENNVLCSASECCKTSPKCLFCRF